LRFVVSKKSIRAIIAEEVKKAGVLKISVLSGRNLKDKDLFGNNDPYVKVKLLQYGFQTKVKSGAGADPVWEETFSMELDGKSSDASVEFKCYDEDTLHDDKIGSTLVKLTDLVAKPGAEVWYTITGKSGKSHGELGIAATYKAWVPGVLRLTLADAKNLTDHDSMGKQDPYAKLFIDDEREKKSKVHDGGGSFPSWNEDFSFILTGKEKMLTVKIYDKDTLSDDKIGAAQILLQNLKEQPEDEIAYYPVKDDGKNAGEVGFMTLWKPSDE
jgi:Ca2+-dependent lipid-binding protein